MTATFNPQVDAENGLGGYPLLVIAALGFGLVTAALGFVLAVTPAYG
jgi:hypothetical protein